MNVGTRSLLFGVHQCLLHPLFVTLAWRTIYRQWPRLHEWAAVFTHDWGYWGCANIDGEEGEAHPEVIARWWLNHFGAFGDRVAREILGHSQYYATKNNLPLSRLYRPDKLASALYPRWLYLLLGNLSGEIHEYMRHCENGKYSGHIKSFSNQRQWLTEMRADMTRKGLLTKTSNERPGGYDGPPNETL